MNNLNNWAVGLLTSSKHEEYIEVFREAIKNLGFDFVCYTEENYPDNGTNIHNNCLLNQTNFDIAILLLDERYGTIDKNVDDNETSITKAEYINASKSKITITFIKSDVFDDYKKYKKDSTLNFGNKYDNQKATFNFINEIEDGKLGESVLLHTFNGIDNLRNLIIEQIKGLSKQVARKYILEVNLKQVENYKRPGQVFTVGNIIGNKAEETQSSGYYIEPNSIDPRKISISSISDFIKKRLKGDEKGNVTNTIVHGNAGTGKSTSLMKAYLSHNKDYNQALNCNCPLNKMPVFFSLSNIKIDKNFNPFDAILSESNKKPFPIKDFWNTEDYVFYFDAFDECMYAESLEKTKSALDILSKYKHVLTTRSSNYRYIERNFPNLNAYENVAKIEGWNHGKIIEYIDAKYAEYPDEDKDKIKRIFDVVDKVFPPLFVTLCLYNVDLRKTENGFGDLSDIIKKDQNERFIRGTILKEAVENNLRHEILKETNDEIILKKQLNRKLDILYEAGWKINSCRNEHEPISPKDLIDYLNNQVFKNRFKDLNSEDKKKFIEKTLKIYFDLSNSSGIRAVHSLFIDLFGSCCYLQKLKNKKISNTDAKILLSSEGNRMVGDFVTFIPVEERQTYIEYLICNYKKSKSLDERVIYCYTIPRLVNNYNPGDKVLAKVLIKFCLSTYVKCVLTRHVSEQVMLLNWMVQFGDRTFEKIYYRKLCNSRFAEANRIAYMIYMNQSGSKINLSDSDRKQTPKREWIDTLVGVLEHYNTNDKRHRYIRRIDIKILRTYINAGYSIYPDQKVFSHNGKDYTLLGFFEMLKENEYVWELTTEGKAGEKFMSKIQKHSLFKTRKINKAKRELLKEVDLMISDLKRISNK